jgi:peroxiredoxin
MSTLNTELLELEAQYVTGLAPETRNLRDMSMGAMRECSRALAPLPVGALAPEFQLASADGARRSLAELRRQGRVLVHFYRGHWCPFCRKELAAYAVAQPRFRQLGVQLVFLSPDPPEVSRRLLREANWELTFLSDPGAQVAAQFGVRVELDPATRQYYESAGVPLAPFDGAPCWRLPAPASFLVNGDGRVALSHHETDFRQRLDPVDLVIRVSHLLE